MRVRAASYLGIRLAMLALALGVATWSSWIFRTTPASPYHDDLIQQLSTGETFSSESLDRLAPPCSNMGEATILPRTALLHALVAVRRAEDKLPGENASQIAARVSCAGNAVRVLLRLDPASGLGWYLMAWLTHLEVSRSARASTFLEHSVLLAPRELWMAVQRRPLMEIEVLHGRSDQAGGDYRTLAAGDRAADAASLLKACLASNTICGVDWSKDLPSRDVRLVQIKMLDEH